MDIFWNYTILVHAFYYLLFEVFKFLFVGFDKFLHLFFHVLISRLVKTITVNAAYYFKMPSLSLSLVRLT